MDLKKEVIFAAESYARAEVANLQMKLSKKERMLSAGCLRAGALSGIMLAARFLASNEGSDEVTPQLLEKAAIEAAREIGFTVSAIPHPPEAH